MTTSAFKSSVAPVTKRVGTPAVSGSAKSAAIEIEALIAYPSLVSPDPKSGDKFNALFLVTDPDSQQALRDLVAETSELTFRNSQLPPGAHNPLRDSNERTPSGEYAFKHPKFRVEGGLVFRAKTAYQPECVWGPNETPIEPAEITGGDEVVVQVSAYGYANQSSGVALSLGRVWLIRKGDEKIERGTGSAANVRRLDRSRLRFSEDGAAEEA
jgi:hypothetical protein